MSYSTPTKKETLEVPEFVNHGKKKNKALKPKKVKTAKMIIKFFGFGWCIGFIPMAITVGNEIPELYIVPLIPVALYLINRVIKDLKGWYQNEEM